MLTKQDVEKKDKKKKKKVIQGKKKEKKKKKKKVGNVSDQQVQTTIAKSRFPYEEAAEHILIGCNEIRIKCKTDYIKKKKIYSLLTTLLLCSSHGN